MKSSALKIAALAAMSSALSAPAPIGKSRNGVHSKTQLTKKQRKARAKAKRAKQARKRNRH